MQTTSAAWKALWTGGNAWLESKAVIDGVEYTDISAPQITRGLMQNGLSVGNAVSATCQFSVRTSDIIAKSAEVVVKMRLTDGVTASEWLTAGTFYISHRTRDPITNVLSLECYDALLKGNAELKSVPWTTNTGEVMTNDAGEWLYFSASYPRRMDELLDDILLLLGLELDPRTQIETGASYTVDDPGAGATINTVLGLIAAAHGGNWIITPEGKLRLVPVVSAANAASAVDAVDVLGVTGQMAVNGGGTVTGIRYTVDNESRIAGNDTGIVIDAEVSAAVANALLTRLGGMTYQSYELSGAVYDPAAELGDYVRAGANGEVASALYVESKSLGPAFRGDISAPEAGELADEYPYIGAVQRNYNRALQYADAAAQNAANNLDLTLTQQEIFDRLTDGGLEQGLALESTTNPGPSAAGDKKLYLNLDYARFGKLVADFIQGGTLKLGGLDNVNGELQILDANNNVIGTWDKDGITVNAGTIIADAIKGGILSLGGLDNEDGMLRILDADENLIGAWTNSGIIINRGQISFSSSDSTGEGTLVISEIAEMAFNYTWDDIATGYTYTLRVYANGLWMQNNTLNSVLFLTNDRIYIHRTSASETNHPRLAMLDEVTGKSVEVETDHGLLLQNYSNGNYTIVGRFDHSGISTTGSLTVSGTKSRSVETDQYADRLLYCYETPTPMFGDVGEGEIGEDGLCYIWLDPVFAQTIATSQYQVFLQPYGSGTCWVDRREGSCFVVRGEPGMKFGWEIKAKQKGYDQRRLERDETPFAVPEQTYGADAAQYIEDLKKGRVKA